MTKRGRSYPFYSQGPCLISILRDPLSIFSIFFHVNQVFFHMRKPSTRVLRLVLNFLSALNTKILKLS